MQEFTAEAAEQVIGLLCYSRTEDTYSTGFPGEGMASTGAFRFSATGDGNATRLLLTDLYHPVHYRTITIEAALHQGLLAPSWEDLAAKLYLNDQDILYMCLLRGEGPVCLRLLDSKRIMAYRDQHIDKAKAKKFTYMPHRSNKNLRLIPKKERSKSARPEITSAPLREIA
jgi:hypothetical protein